ncbi:hypothetical protein JCM30237_13830 [Halolamina litorea]|uniref:Uncharacterized protein n=1 Tax=Halolamina litorea TaxID=1515593 RepID=A0ABD6BPR7_9EURY|nr:hypothetical protein [Halolamina litorea]
MVDPIFTYVGGIAFLVLIIVPVVYLMYASDPSEDELAGQSVVGGVGAADEREENGEEA